MIVEVPYGRAPRAIDLGERPTTIVRPRAMPPPALVDDLLRDLVVPPAGRVTVIVSDATRDEPREAFLRAIRRRLSSTTEVTLAIATSTHGPAGEPFWAPLAALLGAAAVVDHDGHRDDDLVSLGQTSRGTPVVVHRCVVETDLVIATGCIRPHYFAGFGAGAKAIFPGLGQARAIRINHALKTAPRARAGIVDGNPCREDLDEAVARLPTPVHLINGVCGPDHAVHAMVWGGLFATGAWDDDTGAERTAFRRGCAVARSWFTTRAPRAPLVIASDDLPVTASLYQAAKIAAAAAPFVEENGTLVVAASCFEGIEPLDVVNEAIFRIGVLPRLAPGVSLQLLSDLNDADVARTLLSPCHVDTLRVGCEPALVLPYASQILSDVE